MINHLHCLGQRIWKCRFVPLVTKILQNFRYFSTFGFFVYWLIIRGGIRVFHTFSKGSNSENEGNRATGVRTHLTLRPHRNIKVKVRSPDGDTEYFDIVAGVLQEDTLAPYLFIICLDYMLRTSIDKIRENGFELTKKRSRKKNNYRRRLRR